MVKPRCYILILLLNYATLTCAIDLRIIPPKQVVRYLKEKSIEVVNNFGPAYSKYINKQSIAKISVTNDSLIKDKQCYRVTLFSDTSKVKFAWMIDIAAIVDIWEDSGVPLRVLFGGGDEIYFNKRKYDEWIKEGIDEAECAKLYLRNVPQRLVITDRFDWPNPANLRRSLYNLIENNSVNNQQEFLMNFPKTWQEFEWMFGLNPDRKNLYSLYNRLITTFFKLDKIEETLFCKYLLSLSIGMRCEQDSQWLFRSMLQERLNDEKISDCIFRSLNENEVYGNIISFWQFVWSVPVFNQGWDGQSELDLGQEPRKNNPAYCLLEKLEDKYKVRYPLIVKNMRQAFYDFYGKMRFSVDVKNRLFYQNNGNE